MKLTDVFSINVEYYGVHKKRAVHVVKLGDTELARDEDKSVAVDLAVYRLKHLVDNADRVRAYPIPDGYLVLSPDLYGWRTDIHRNGKSGHSSTAFGEGLPFREAVSQAARQAKAIREVT